MTAENVSFLMSISSKLGENKDAEHALTLLNRLFFSEVPADEDLQAA